MDRMGKGGATGGRGLAPWGYRGCFWAFWALACLVQPRGAGAQQCEDENVCSFKKPNVLLVLDYSSSMTGSKEAPAFFPPGQTLVTRWGAELDAASWILRYDNGFFANNARIALSRFGHDPDLKAAGTTIRTDHSFPPITDGYALDVPFDGSDGKYLQCKGSGVEAAVEVLRKAPPPPVGTMAIDRDSIMLTWTRGALRSAHNLIDRTREHHKNETGESGREYQVVLMTDGDWTCPDTIGQGCDENPAPEAARLRAAGVPVYVIAFGDAAMQPSLNEVALQGGTGKAVDATSPQGIVDAFSSVLDNIRDSVIVPTCTQKLPRVLITMDASSSMLNGTAPGQTKWDKARFALSGNPAAPNPTDPGYVEPVLTHKVKVNGRDVAIEDLVHVGMVAFAGGDQQKLMFNFGPCMRDNIAWAMDPATSCAAPGCKDPYAGAPLRWTFKDSGQSGAPRFVRPTHSYMPVCAEDAENGRCAGAAPTTFTGQGLEFSRKLIVDYKRNSAPFSQTTSTRYVNVLITDGETSEGSSDVQAVLRGLVQEGVDTYVIGFGTSDELNQPQLDQYAVWGNTQKAIVVDPSRKESASALGEALTTVVTSLGLDSCCVLNQCSSQPEPEDPHAVCGDGKVEGDEVCDDGELNATYGHCSARCQGKHLFCGDGRTDGPEECDDGNAQEHDGCTNGCIHVAEEEDAGVGAAAGSGGSRVGTVPPGTAAVRSSAGRGAVSSAVRSDPPVDAGMDAGPSIPPGAKQSCNCSAVGSKATTRSPSMIALLCVGLLFVFRRRSPHRSWTQLLPRPQRATRPRW